MTIEADESQGAPSAPQAVNNDDDLKSLLQTFAERLALLERGTDMKPTSSHAETNEDGELLSPRLSSFDGLSERSIIRGQLSTDHEIASDENLNVVTGIPEEKTSNNDIEEALQERVKLLEQRMEDYEDEKDVLLDNINSQGEYHLAESTISLLITQPPLSIPFMFGLCSAVLPIACLSLVLASSISKGTSRNRLGIPAGVAATTRAAQFLGALVGVLMEDEVPQGLQLMANAAGHKLFLNGQQQKEVRMRVFISSVFRLTVGYLFLSALFMQIAQNRDVIEIFFDVLALEFVENIDDTTFALAKRGFFGRSLLFATNQKYTLQMPEMRSSLAHGIGRNRVGALDGQVPSDWRLSSSGLIASKNRVNFLVKIIYFLNAIIIFVGLGYISKTQYDGKYRTRSVRVIFDEEIWEKANVRIGDDIVQRLLIYSYFNGIYEEAGSYGGYPRYVERRKNQGATSLSNDGSILFGSDLMPGAEMVYCPDIERWIFRHPNITTSFEGGEGNECSWLWKSAETDDYDILSTNDGVWEAWVGSNGKVKPHVTFSVQSALCYERSDCNYHGKCVENHCICDYGYFGEACQFDWPCETLATEKAHTLDKNRGMVWNMKNPIRLVNHTVYNRPLFIQTGLKGEPYDMRLYKILEADRSDPPSNQPSIIPSTLPSSSPTLKPSLSQQPSDFPSLSPSISSQPTNIPSVSIEPSNTPTESHRGTHKPTIDETISPTSYPTIILSRPSPSRGEEETYSPSYTPSASATKFLPPTSTFAENDYDTAPDFADVDDFFERQPLHDLEEILEDYSVVLTFAGSRFYGTIIHSNASLDKLFPDNYHAFWDQSFNVNRTFIISDTTFGSSPVGVDFYEMRRRINELLNPDIHFSYGPYGAMIPLMDYEGAGFFHCMDETADPSLSPSSSVRPSLQPSISQYPTVDQCIDVEVNIFADGYPEEISWILSKEGTDDDGAESIATSDNFFYERESLVVSNVCLYEGNYTFTIRDRAGDGIFDPGYYNVTSNGILIKSGGGSNGFQEEESVSFSVPYFLEGSNDEHIAEDKGAVFE